MTELRARDEQINRKRIEKTSNSIFGFFINRRKITLLLTIMLSLWGLSALTSLPREANPEVKIPIAVVSTVWPGASPADIEDLVTDEIEAKLKSLENVKEISSSSTNSVSSITVEFEADADLDESISDLRDRVDTVVDLPDEATDPAVIEVSINDQAIVTFSLVADLTETELKTLAQRLEDEIEGISGVSDVVIVGDRDREWRIAIDPARLKQFNLSGSDITRAISSAHLNVPLGSVEIDRQNYAVRSVGKIETIEQLGSVVVSNRGGNTILLRDVADVNDQLVEQKTISRLATAGNLPQNTVSLQLFKQTGGNIITIVDSAKEKIANLEEAGIIPSSVEVVVANDNSKFIRKDFNTLTRSGVQTLILIFVSLALALAFRMALLAVISIPIIFLSSFGIIDMQGSTLNSLTLFSLVLALGLLIDTTIVLLEGIHEGLRKGYDTREAALLSIDTYKWPIIAGVFTTISAFVPMFLVGGIVGEFLKTLPITISAVLGSSLIVGLFIMPAMSTYLIRKDDGVHEPTWLQKRLFQPISDWYHPTIHEVLASKKKRRNWYLGVSALFILSFGMLFSGIVKTELFPKSDFDFFLINVELPQGSVLEETELIIKQVEQEVTKIQGLENYLTTIGRSTGAGFGDSGSSSEHLGSVLVNLKDTDERDLKSYDITEQIRPMLTAIEGARVEVEDLEGGPPTGDPVGIEIRGTELDTLSDIALEIKQGISGIDGIYDIESNDKPSPPQFVYRLDHELLGRYGLSGAQVSQELRTALFGLDVATVTIDGDDIDMIVQFDEATVTSPDAIRNIEILSPTGERIKVAQVADITLEPALQTIRHKDTKRTVFINAKIRDRSPREVQTDIDKAVAEIQLPRGYEIVQGGEFEAEADAFGDLYKAMYVAVILIFLIMVMMFNSFKQPFVILFTLPLAFIGVIFGTFIFNMPFGFPTFLGVVALVGIVVNDAIVLIDRINFNRSSRRMDMNTAIAEAGEARLQPIILTTTTTVLGVVPLAFADEFWRGLSVAIGSGIIFATSLTLFIIPLLYQKFETKKAKKQ